MIICLDQRTGSGCGATSPNGAYTCQQCGQSLRYALTLRDPGDVVGDYRIICVIGHGMFGAVYEAEAVQQQAARVALKETLDPASIGSFRQEFALLHRLHHPNLPRYYELFEAQGNGYLVMEYIPGETLEERLHWHAGALHEAEVVGYALQLCDVLEYLHRQQPPIVHRDIKPANIRLTPGGQINLVDFGLLKQGTQQTRRTIRGIGTPAYAPIEQYSGSGQTDPRSDMYSLGATLYHLLTGQEPPPATDRIATSPDPLCPPRDHNPQLSQPISAAVLKALALAQQQRWDSINLLRHALLTASGQQPPHQQPPALVLRDHNSPVWCAAYSPDGQMLASGGSDGMVRLWRVADGSPLVVFAGHTGEVMCLDWQPGGGLLASGGADGIIRVYQAVQGEYLWTLRGHTARVLCLSFSPDGHTLASGSEDRTVRLWRMRDGSLHQTLSGHQQMILGLCWSPDGRSLSSVSTDGTVRIWGGLR